MLNSKNQADNSSTIEPQQHIETTSSPTCTKLYVGSSFVYAFQYCPCTYESAFATMSIHRTYKSAYKRMKIHKLELFEEWMNQSRWSKKRFKFGWSEKWAVKKIKIC